MGEEYPEYTNSVRSEKKIKVGIYIDRQAETKARGRPRNSYYPEHSYIYIFTYFTKNEHKRALSSSSFRVVFETSEISKSFHRTNTGARASSLHILVITVKLTSFIIRTNIYIYIYQYIIIYTARCFFCTYNLSGWTAQACAHIVFWDNTVFF